MSNENDNVIIWDKKFRKERGKKIWDKKYEIKNLGKREEKKQKKTKKKTNQGGKITKKGNI